MKTATFKCDACGFEGKADESCIRPVSSGTWIQLSIAPFCAGEHPDKVPSAVRDVCSTACAVKLLKSWQTKLEELRREATR